MKQAIAIGLVLLLHGSILWHSATQTSASVDELSHLATGLYSLSTLDFRINRTAPPFQNIVDALPVYCTMDYDLSFDNQNWSKGIWNGVGDRLLEANPKTFHQILMRGRLGTIVLSMLVCLVAFLWSKQIWGTAAAWFVLIFVAFEPNLMAHGRLTTTDTAPTLFFLLSGFFLWRFFQKSNWKHLALVGIGFGLTWYSKHSGVVLLPAFFLAILAALWWKRIDIDWFPISRMCSWHPTLRHFIQTCFLVLIISVIGFVVVWAGYGFEIGDSIPGPRKPGQSYIWNELSVPIQTIGYFFNIPSMTNLDPADTEHPFWLFLRGYLPAFSHWEGFFANRSHIKSGHMGYFMGMLSGYGWRSYYPVLFLIKTPLPLLLVMAVGGLVLVLRWVRLSLLSWLSLVVIPAIYLVILIFFNTANIGYRHALPAVPYFIVLFGGAAVKFAVECFCYAFRKDRLSQERVELFQSLFSTPVLPKGISMIFAVLVAAMLYDVLSIHPHYLCYFNSLIGGPRQGHYYAVDSNLDWGQDLLTLKKYMKAHHMETVNLLYFGPEPLPDMYGVPHVNGKRMKEFTPGTYAISATLYHGIGAGGIFPKLTVFHQREPDDYVTPGMFIYRLE